MADRTRRITIGTREIGADRPCFIIAEAGINHNGDVDAGRRAASRRRPRPGRTPIKIPDALSRSTRCCAAARPAAYVGESLFDLLTRTAVSRDDHFALRDAARRRKASSFLSTPFSREAADFLETVGVPAFKTGSGELTHVPLQRHIARKGKPMIISTGMSTPRGDRSRPSQAVRARRRAIRADALHLDLSDAVSEHVQLDCIAALQSTIRCAGRLLGPHARQLRWRSRPSTLGANLFEKHFHDVPRSLPGPDQQGSMEPAELDELVTGIRAIEQARGATRCIQPGEQGACTDMALHSVVSMKDICRRARIGADDVWAKRPGTGIPARQLR